MASAQGRRSTGSGRSWKEKSARFSSRAAAWICTPTGRVGNSMATTGPDSCARPVPSALRGRRVLHGVRVRQAQDKDHCCPDLRQVGGDQAYRECLLGGRLGSGDRQRRPGAPSRIRVWSSGAVGVRDPTPYEAIEAASGLWMAGTSGSAIARLVTTPRSLAGTSLLSGRRSVVLPSSRLPAVLSVSTRASNGAMVSELCRIWWVTSCRMRRSSATTRRSRPATSSSKLLDGFCDSRGLSFEKRRRARRREFGLP